MTDTLAVDALYEEHRRFLWSVCYRMTGSAADADDVVQDTFVRTIQRPPDRIDEPLRPWLVKVALNLACDLLRRRRRREYVGPWLPSPVQSTDASQSQEAVSLEVRYGLTESVSFAFLVALEVLTPVARAVLLLRDVFDYSVKETADALGLSHANVKTTHHRARRAMTVYDGARQIPTAGRLESSRSALTRFLRALEAHDVGAVEAMLADDVRTTIDGGGQFKAALRTIAGRAKVVRFYLAVAASASGGEVRITRLNGVASAVVHVPSPRPGGAPKFTLTTEVNREGKIAHIYVVSAEAKLAAVS